MVDIPSKTRTLFDQLTVPESLPEQKKEKPGEKPLIESAKPIEMTNRIETNIPSVEEKTISQNKLQDQFFSSEKPIERLIIFYNDQTFKVYNPSR